MRAGKRGAACGWLPVLLGAVLILAAAFLTFSAVRADREAGRAAEETVQKLKSIIREDPDARLPEDPEVLEIDGHDCIGYFEAIGTDIAFPVESSDGDGLVLPKVESGNPKDGAFMIRGPYKKSIFGRLVELTPGGELRLYLAGGAKIPYRIESSGLLRRKSDIIPQDLVLFCRHTPGGWYAVSAVRETGKK